MELMDEPASPKGHCPLPVVHLVATPRADKPPPEDIYRYRKKRNYSNHFMTSCPDFCNQVLVCQDFGDLRRDFCCSCPQTFQTQTLGETMKFESGF